MMMSAFNDSTQETSALYALEASLKPGTRVCGPALLEAVQYDIDHVVPLSRVLFMKQVSANPALSIEELQAILDILKPAVLNQIEGNAEASLSYAHAAILCSTELHSRRK